MAKNYSEIYVSLREEIMQQIANKVGDIFVKYEVDNLSDLENAPEFMGYITEWVEDGLGNSELALIKVCLTDIWEDGQCAGYKALEFSTEEPYGLNEFLTDSLIDIYDKLSEI